MSRFFLFCVAIIICSCQSKPDLNADQLQSIFDNKDRWNRYVREMYIDQLLVGLSAAKPSTILFKDVNIIAMTSEEVKKGSVLVKDGKIEEVMYDEVVSPPKEAMVIEGTGKYLLPGLVDAHVHVGESSNSDLLLYLANGVTAIREMCGFDWMIPYREEIKKNKVLAPNLYLAGTMLNNSDLGIYSDVVKTEEEGREKVRMHKKKGYDYIKVWNVMPSEILSAIADECRVQGMDLVGHVPHDVTVTQAISVGYRTMEHFKGFILDRSLTLSDENYLTAIEASEHKFWLSPTFSLRLQGMKGDKASVRLKEDAAYRYISLESKEAWRQEAENYDFGEYGNKPDSIFKMGATIFDRLKPLKPNYIAGTDHNGSNSFMVAGFILNEELKIFRSLGMSNYEILRTATVNAAEALNRLDEFGTIEAGKRADLLLLNANPFDNINNLSSRTAVVVRGVYLPEEKIANILQQIHEIYQGTSDYLTDNTKINQLYRELVKHYYNELKHPAIKPINQAYFAWRLGQIGKYDDAVTILKQVLNGYEDYTTHDILASVYLKTGDTVRAVAHYQRSLMIYPYDSEAEQQLKLLSK